MGAGPLEEGARHDLLEVIDDRAGNRSTILASQLPIEHWHGWINDPTLADAILDRLVHSAYRLTLKGESLRRKKLRSKPHRDRCDYNPQPAQPGRKHRSRISETLGHVHRNPQPACLLAFMFSCRAISSSFSVARGQLLTTRSKDDHLVRR